MTDTLTHSAPQLADLPERTVLAIDGEETYLNDPTVAAPQELVTRVAVAMHPAGEDARA
jgi:hypothetical protein